jgi:hypothetical protein
VEKKLKRLKEEMEMKKLDGDIAVRVTGQTGVVDGDQRPVKMEKGVIMELPVPGSKPVSNKRKHVKIEETPATFTPTQQHPTQIVAADTTKQASKPAVLPKREKIAFGFGKTKKLAPKKLE